jgi:hypothetical protein
MHFVQYGDRFNAIWFVRKQGDTHDARCRELTAPAMSTGDIPASDAEEWLLAIARKSNVWGT